MEVARKYEEAGLRPPHIAVPASSKQLRRLPPADHPGIISHWEGSAPTPSPGVACVECHKAEEGDADGFEHYGYHIATIVTPRDCARCHESRGRGVPAQPPRAAGNILASLDNFLAETVEGGGRRSSTRTRRRRARRSTWSTAWPAPSSAASSATAARWR